MIIHIISLVIVQNWIIFTENNLFHNKNLIKRFENYFNIMDTKLHLCH